ncbi:uncharacterized protein yc1106_06785 [Curvularia clavata]|uniref:Uncharacterized protein n=1 Tax=Curvularia clavata TaxID=95742 RepID=A0A9Q8ZAF1_CURCL|nr:uncharacterized protein yc1106_06785 [Curvularia clavata]
MSSYHACDIMNKNMTGLKEYKKMQKAKKCAKRTAAAQEAKAKIAHPAMIAAIGAGDAMSTKRASADQELLIVTSEPKVTFDVVAHRKALEASLYEKMETPLQMLIRCQYQLSLDAEYYTMDDVSADVVLGAKSVDDNGFETISCMVGSDNNDEPTVEETPMSFQDNVNAEKTVVCLPRAPEAVPCGSISIEQLFAAVAAKEKVAIISSQKAPPSTSSYGPHWADPAIVNYRIKQQASRKDSVSTINSSRSSFSMLTPDSSPATQRSYIHSSARPWTPPTPTFFSPALGHWAPYPEPKPYNMCWNPPCMNWVPPQWPMGQWRK